MFEYTYTAKAKLGLDGTVVEPGAVVAMIRTEHPIDNILSAIRVHAVACERKKLPPEESSEPKAAAPGPEAAVLPVRPKHEMKKPAATAARK